MRSIQLGLAALAITVAFLPPMSRGQAQPTRPMAERIAQSRIIGELAWVGEQPPSDADSETLLAILQNVRAFGGAESLARFEEYVMRNPASPWTPSVRANLALNYRRMGRYSLALQHWEIAWHSVSSVTSGGGKRVGDFILVNWLQLLSSLGRIEKLEEILGAVGHRNLENHGWQVTFNSVRASLEKMRSNPAISFRCGTLALYAAAKAGGNTNQSAFSLLDLPSPPTGFAMSSLLHLSEQHRLDFVAVRRPSGAPLIVPSVIHWREGHYAAITRQHHGRYFVTDPTFGASQWLTADVIDAETSGHFLVPSKLAPENWPRLGSDDLQGVFGKGLDSGPPRPEPPSCDESGDGGGESCSDCDAPKESDAMPWWPKGMPTWRVSEPYTALWLHDKPMFYQTAKGPEFSLRLTYHSDGLRPDDTNVFNFGPLWNCSWLSYIDVADLEYYAPGDPIDPLFVNYSATNYGAAGGWRRFAWYDSLYGDVPYYEDQTTFEKLDDGTEMTGARIHYPNGSAWTYGLQIVQAEYQPLRRLFLTEQADPQGRVTRFYYSTNTGKVYLTQVVDTDGKTNWLSYSTNSATPTQVLAVTNRFGEVVRFNYETNRLLTNIVDVVALATSFSYLQTNGIYALASYTTPYGQTGFEYLAPLGNLYGTSSGTDDINRAIRVTAPNGAQHLYIYRDHTPSTPARTDGPVLSCSYSEVPTNGYQTWTGCGTVTAGENGGFCNYNMIYRNSFYWGPRQVEELSTTDLLLLTQADYNRARLRNWLHGDGGIVGRTINLQRDPSPDGTTLGQHTWFAYFKPSAHFQGTNINPNFVARVLPNGETHFVYREYNHLGRVTLEKTSITDGAAIAYRTNRFVYADNAIDLIRRYDGFDRLVESNAFNALHQVITHWNAAGDKTTYTYNANAQLTGARLPTELIVTNAYDPEGYLTNTAEVAGSATFRSAAFTYTNGQVLTRRDELGAWVTNTWDALRRLTSRRDSGGTIAYAYSNLDLVQITDRLGNVTRFGYDSMRRKVWELDPRTNRTSYVYCNCGSLESVTNALNEAKHFVYDGQGKRTQVIAPDGSTVTHAYNLLGQLVKVSDSAGLSETNWYNNQGLLVASSNALGRVRSLAYDVDGRLTNSIDANGVSVGFLLDALGRTIARTYPDAGVERFAYTARGLIAHTNRLGMVTRYFYDEARRKTLETNANVEITQFKYDAAGNLTNLIDAKAQNTYWRYDLHGRVIEKLDHATTSLFVYRYDASHRLTNRWSAAKLDTFYSYDPAGNLVTVNYPTDPDLTLQYDALNRVTNRVDALGSTRYGFTSFGAVQSEDGPWASDTVSYTYSNHQRSGLSLEQPNTSPWTQAYGYDAIRRLTNVTSSAGVFGYGYHAGLGGFTTASALTKSLTHPGGTITTNAFDSVGRLTETRLRTSAGTLLNLHDYVVNAGHQRTRQTRVEGDFVDYAYDNIGQLKSGLGAEPGGTTHRWHERFYYGYDQAGNLSNRVQNVQTNVFHVNALNQLTSVVRTNNSATVAGVTTIAATSVTVADNGNPAGAASRYADRTFARTNLTLLNGNNTFVAVATDAAGRGDTNTVTVSLPIAVTFLYDQNGNLRTNGSKILEYDDENQLTRITEPNSWKSEFVYDGLMRRRIRREYAWRNSAWVMTQEVRYVYDGNLVIQERDQFNLPKVTYTRSKDLSGDLEGAGGIGGLLARTEHDLDAKVHVYYSADGNGNVTCLVDTNQVVVGRYLYDPFGNTLSATGPMAEANLYRFSSKELHAASGLIYYLYRYYDPNLQRWVNGDPIGELGSINLYRYVRNNPASFYDPFGLVDYPPGFIGPPMPSPALPDPSWKPPGYDPSWPEGHDKWGPYYEDPNTGEKWHPHPEDDRHWPHYDSDKHKDKKFPEKNVKPRPGQYRNWKPNQCPTNPWPQPPPPPPLRWWERIPLPPIIINPMIVPPWMLGEPTIA